MNLRIYEYEPGPTADLVIARWWMRLVADDELSLVSMRPAGLSAFYEQMAYPRRLVYIKRDEDIAYAGWVEPIGGAAFMSYWMRSDVRGTRESPSATALIYRACFGIAGCSTFLGITKQERLLDIHRKLGYNILGVLPGLWMGKDAILATLTRSDFESSRLVRVASRCEGAASGRDRNARIAGKQGAAAPRRSRRKRAGRSGVAPGARNGSTS